MLISKVVGFTVMVLLRSWSVSYIEPRKGGLHVSGKKKKEKKKDQRCYPRHAWNKK